MSTFIGIDPGLKGAIAFLRSTDLVRIVPTPTCGNEYDEFEMSELIAIEVAKEERVAGAYIEQVQAFPGQGRSSAVKIGLGQGLWRMALTTCGVSRTIVNPRKWQRVMFAGVSKQDTKKMSIIAAKRLFPGVSLRRTEKCRTDDHNMADALLIAEYGRRQMGAPS